MEMWRRADAEIVAAEQRAEVAIVEQLEWIEVARREGTHRKLGFGTFYEYLRTRLGLGKRAAFERMRIAKAVGELPATRAALKDGRLLLSGAKEVTRVATVETEGAWLERVVGRPISEVEELVSGRMKGALPDDPREPESTVVERTYEMMASTHALLMKAKEMLEKAGGALLSDDEFLKALAERTIGAVQAGDEVPAVQRKVIVTACPDCEAAHMMAAGQMTRIDPSELGEIDLDEVIALDELISAHMDTRTVDIPAPVKRAVYLRDRGRCTVPGCAGTHFLHFHHILHREHGGLDEPWNLTLLCSAHHIALHKRRLVIHGTRAGALTYFHADGTPYGRQPVEISA